jgi:hypothetical protein
MVSRSGALNRDAAAARLPDTESEASNIMSDGVRSTRAGLAAWLVREPWRPRCCRWYEDCTC